MHNGRRGRVGVIQIGRSPFVGLSCEIKVFFLLAKGKRMNLLLDNESKIKLQKFKGVFNKNGGNGKSILFCEIPASRE